MLDTLTRPPVATQPRQPALYGYLMRKLKASGEHFTERRTLVETCRAELDWSIADWKRITPRWRGFDHEAASESVPFRLPHEAAAARVLNCWGHLHPVEYRIRENLTLIRAQLKAADALSSYSEAHRADWAQRAERTRAYMRLILTDRRKAAKAFFAAVAEYRRLRTEIDAKETV